MVGAVDDFRKIKRRKLDDGCPLENTPQIKHFPAHRPPIYLNSRIQRKDDVQQSFGHQRPTLSSSFGGESAAAINYTPEAGQRPYAQSRRTTSSQQYVAAFDGRQPLDPAPFSSWVTSAIQVDTSIQAEFQSHTTKTATQNLIGDRTFPKATHEQNNPKIPRTSKRGQQNVCYGMLCGIAVEDVGSYHGWAQCEAARWNGQRYLQHAGTGRDIVGLSPHTLQLLRTLSESTSATFQFLVQEQERQGQKMPFKMASRALSVEPALFLSIIIYGPLEMANDVGDWLNSMQMYLQTPEGCDRDVLYMNPHCLSFDEEANTTTFQLAEFASLTEVKDCETRSDPFAELYSDVMLDEAPQPDAIASVLHKHQRQALTFMLEREKGWDFTGSKSDIWKSHIDSFGTTRYKNTISGTTQTSIPKHFRGGIIADEMGLGKTCSMLSLIAANPLTHEVSNYGNARSTAADAVKATLVVVPFSLLQVWEKQIVEHFRPGSIRFVVFYGAIRQQNIDVENYDIVVTTYNTIALEWKRFNSQGTPEGTSLLFRIFWHRVILDEAHVIRTRDTANAKSVCALRADRRWCITGTPIQNRLTDIFSLFSFLRVHPYDDWKTFEEEILRPWKCKMDENALKRLQLVMKAIAIRRPKTVITLPACQEFVESVSFTADERAVYEKAQTGVIEVLESAMSTGVSSRSVYLNAFQKINDLRYICNHGVSPTRRRMAPTASNQLATGAPISIQHELDQWMDNNGWTCSHCGTDIQEEEESERLLVRNSDGFLQDLSSRLCKRCLKRNGLYETLPPSPSPSPHAATPSTLTPSLQPSSKIQALLAKIQQISPVDKCAIFSFWTSTLDAMEQAFTDAGITFSRYDGRMNRSKRDTILHSFASNPSIRVILVSISCGGQGLDLTAANHAFLLEPQWNPMLEEQAMSRVHRLGQTKPVRLVRFVMKDTWEEKIVGLQKRKRNLADLIVDRRGLRDGGNGKRELSYLKELVA